MLSLAAVAFVAVSSAVATDAVWLLLLSTLAAAYLLLSNALFSS